MEILTEKWQKFKSENQQLTYKQVALGAAFVALIEKRASLNEFGFIAFSYSTENELVLNFKGNTIIVIDDDPNDSTIMISRHDKNVSYRKFYDLLKCYWNEIIEMFLHYRTNL